MTEKRPQNTPLFNGTFIRENPEMARDCISAYWSGKMRRAVNNLSEFVVLDLEDTTTGFLGIIYESIKGDISWRRDEDPVGYHKYNPADVWGPYNIVRSARKRLISGSPEKYHDRVHVVFSEFVEFARKRALIEICPDDELEYAHMVSGGFETEAINSL